MDVLDRTLEKALQRRRAAGELHDNQLAIRYTQYSRETPELRHSYYRTTDDTRPARSDYDITVGWTETYSYSRQVKKTRRVSYTEDGQTKWKDEDYWDTEYKTETASKREGYRVGMCVEEVLRNDAYAHESKVTLPSADSPSEFGWSLDSASQSGKHTISFDEAEVNRIMASGSKARTQEAPLRRRVDEYIAVTAALTTDRWQQIRKDPKARGDQIAKLDKVIAGVQEDIAALQTYAKWDDAQVRAQWGDDSLQSFRARNEELLRRHRHLENRVSLLREQVRREQEHLDVHVELPDYSVELAELKKYHDRARMIQLGVGVTAAAGGAGYAYGKDEVDEFVVDKAEVLREKWNSVVGR
jgi:hypothetical protein